MVMQSCRHCSLPTHARSMHRQLNGETHYFCCYGCYLAFQICHGETEEAESTWLLMRLGVGAFLAMNVMLFSLLLYSGTFGPNDSSLVYAVHVLLWILTTPILLILGVPFLLNAWTAASRARVTSDTLVSIGIIAAYGYSAISVINGSDTVYFDTVTMVLVLFTLGRYLDALGRARAMRNLAPLLASKESRATVITENADLDQPAHHLPIGTYVRIRPGERVPVDGLVAEGHSQCNEAILSGESHSIVKSPGSKVFAGSINGEGQLVVRTTTAGNDTNQERIRQFVRAALAQKSPLTQIVDRVASIFVPVVLLLSVIVIGYWAMTETLGTALMHGLAVLVVACPCAFGLATPLATCLGMSKVLRQGVLIRGGRVLEALATVRGIAFDKTGTLTYGEPRLLYCMTHNTSEIELLQRAAGVEQGSEHPLAKGILSAMRTRGLKQTDTNNIQAHPGQGIAGWQDGVRIVVGSKDMFKKMAWKIPEAIAAHVRDTSTKISASLVYVGWGEEIRGVLYLADALRQEAIATLEKIHSLGLSTYLLTGDSTEVASIIAREAGIGLWRAGLMPKEKVQAVKHWSKQYGTIAMVGDGLNDGPIIAAATVGIAMGSATDLAHEAADIVLPNNGLEQLPDIVKLSRSVRNTILSNIAWAGAYNIVALTLAATGILTPIMAAALMASSSLFVVMNSLHLDKLKTNMPGNPSVLASRFN